MVAMKSADLEVLVGMATAERLLALWYPRFAMSRHRLRRMCMGRQLPCSALPSGTQVRYLVRVADVVRSLKEREQVATCL